MGTDGSDVTDAVLRVHGQHHTTAIGDLHNHHVSYRFPGEFGYGHKLAPRWQIKNSIMLHSLFPYKRPLARLSYRGCSIVNIRAKLIVCMHRRIHGRTPRHVDVDACSHADRLVWLWRKTPRAVASA